jgi:hypothetical protein
LEGCKLENTIPEKKNRGNKVAKENVSEGMETIGIITILTLATIIFCSLYLTLRLKMIFGM